MLRYLMTELGIDASTQFWDEGFEGGVFSNWTLGLLEKDWTDAMDKRGIPLPSEGYQTGLFDKV